MNTGITRRKALLFWPLLLIAFGCGNESQDHANKSSQKAQERKDQTVTVEFPAEGIKKVILRAGAVRYLQPDRVPSAARIVVSGVPSGGAPGYHSPDAGWKETPASEWGLSFKAQRYGDVLVICTQNEIQYIHHSYYLDQLKISLPEGVEFRAEERPAGESGKPDLSPPVEK